MMDMEITKVTFKTSFSSALNVSLGHIFVKPLDKYLLIDIRRRCSDAFQVNISLFKVNNRNIRK